MKKIIITESQLKRIISENVKIKPGSPEELVGLLELLPVNETAKYISEEIYQDVMEYYKNDVKLPKEKMYTYYPEEKCLTPYELTIDFRLSNNGTGIGYASQDYIQVKVLAKDSREYEMLRGSNPAWRLIKDLPNIIKHECSHFYLTQRGIEECLYNTHPDGMKKYYQDRQELVLHSREIFDRFIEDFPSWKTLPIDLITKRIDSRVKNLRSHTNIHAPFNAGTQKKYLSFIMNTYIKPYLES
jgi:hypothetical protein